MLSPRFFSFFPWPFSMDSVLSQPMWPGKAHGKIGLGLRTDRLLKEVNGKPSNDIEGASYRSAQMVNRAGCSSGWRAYLTLGGLSSGMKTADANTVVQSPSLLPMADCVMLEVRTILPDILNSCSRSSQSESGLNSIPRVVASMLAARSSAYSPAFSSVSPKEWCSERYPYCS